MARNLSGGEGKLLKQKDIFFVTKKGRLKLRIFRSERGELIYYERSDKAGPKSSFYQIFRTTDTGGLQKILEASLNVRGIVMKKRWLYLVGQTRIHLDAVKNLGTFLELEVVMEEGQKAKEGEKIAYKLMKKLGVEKKDLIEGAYMDMLEQS